MKTFHICTIVNNWEQYENMRTSFLNAGFDETRCRYSFFDNRQENHHDAYSALDQTIENTKEPYIIFCHQDILLDQQHGFDELLKILSDLDTDDPAWAIAGNAGVTADHLYLRRLHDPWGSDCGTASAPEKVCSLDENFLVIKSSSGIHCSPELNGFHLYGTDLCLQAARKGRTCYIVSFHLTHLSRGRVDSGFHAACKKFQKKWNRSFRFRYITTPCTTIFLSRNKVLSFFFSKNRIKNWIFSTPRRRKLIRLFSDKTHMA